MINVGELVGSLTAAPLNDYLGRKLVFLTATITIIIGVVLQLSSDSNQGYIMGGRVILGYGVGSFSSTSPLYMGVSSFLNLSVPIFRAVWLTCRSFFQEVAPTAIRGPLLMCWQLTLSVSQILAAAINRGLYKNQTILAYKFPIGFQLLFPALVLIFWYFVPESPRWLVRKGKDSQAVDSLQRIHGEDKSYDAATDMAALQASLAAEVEEQAQSSWLSLIKDPIERRKVIYSAGALVAQQINGIQWFYYFGTVFSESIGLSDPFLMTLIVFIIQVAVVLAAVLLANKIPRRPLLLTTTAIMTVSIFIVGCLGIPGGDVSPTFGKVIISFVIIEIVAFNFSWGPLGWTIVGLPPSHSVGCVC